jgi:hypothetical protein
VWEGRAGSLDGPVEASASGGSQGFAQLVCLLGDFTDFTPPAAMQDSLVRLLAHLAHRYDLSTWKDAQAQFISRGSDRWKAGSFIETPTISGHRDMTYTACPGKAAYRLLPEWRWRVHPLVQATRKRPGIHRAERLSPEAPDERPQPRRLPLPRPTVSTGNQIPVSEWLESTDLANHFILSVGYVDIARPINRHPFRSGEAGCSAIAVDITVAAAGEGGDVATRSVAADAHQPLEVVERCRELSGEATSDAGAALDGPIRPGNSRVAGSPRNSVGSVGSVDSDAPGNASVRAGTITDPTTTAEAIKD